jgi:hypothetical protein
MEHNLLLTGKGVKSKGYFEGNCPNNNSKLSYLLSIFLAFYLLLLSNSHIPIL